MFWLLLNPPDDRFSRTQPWPGLRPATDNGGGVSVVELPFDVDNPPDEPPPGIAQQMLWRIAVRLHRDHETVVRDRSGTVTCDLCRQPWPCHGRRLAQRGLVAAWREAVDPAGACGYVDRWLTTDTDGPEA